MAELAEIDENLIRQNLDSIAHGEWLNRRKEIYEELYPETKNGGDRKSEEIRTRPARSDRNKAFAADTAGKLGISKRTVQENIQLTKDLTDKTKEIVRGATTKIKKKDMLKLSRLPAEQQEEAASQLAANTIRSVEEFHPVTEEPDAEEQPLKPSATPEVPAPPSVKTGGNPTIRDLAADLKNPDKDRSPTPDTFVISFSLSMQRFCQNITSFEVSGFASVFPALTQTHLDQIQQEINSVHNTLDFF